MKDETDEDNGLAIDDIMTRLKQEFGDEYHVERKAVRDDIESIKSSGVSIIENTAEHNKKLYSHQERLFETHELRTGCGM